MTSAQIKELRDRGGFSLKEWGYLLGVSYVTIWRWERGDYSPKGSSMTLVELLARDYKRIVSLLRKNRHRRHER